MLCPSAGSGSRITQLQPSDVPQFKQQAQVPVTFTLPLPHSGQVRFPSLWVRNSNCSVSIFGASFSIVELLGFLVFEGVVHLGGWAHLFFVAGDELHAEFAGDVVDHGLCKGDVLDSWSCLPVRSGRG